MKSRSFRRRLAGISMASAALGLLAFGVVADRLWQRNRLELIDGELARLGHALASGGGVRQPWERIYALMGDVLGEEKLERRVMTVRRANGGLLYQSPNWPAQLAHEAFPASAESFDWRGRFDDFYRPGRMRRPRPDRPEHLRRPPEWFLERSERERNRRPEGGGQRKAQRRALFKTALDDSGGWRMGTFANREVHILIGSNLAELRSEVAALRWTALSAALGALTLIGAGAWWLSRKALRPIAALTDATKSISVSDLSQRICLPEADQEFVPLIEVYNDMMDRLETSFHQATRFSADASHELKTPVAIMKGTLERALTEAPPDSPEQRTYASLLEEVDHQQSILQSLLLLSRADAGQLHLDLQALSLSELVREAIDDAEMMVEDLPLALESDIEPNITVAGDRSLLAQVVHNLLTNAIKYNHPNGRMSVALTNDEDHATLTITNTGVAIPDVAKDQIFKRFFRVEAAHSNRTEGSGLGLSLSLEIVRAHGGGLKLESSTDGETVFVATLPVAEPFATESRAARERSFPSP